MNYQTKGILQFSGFLTSVLLVSAVCMVMFVVGAEKRTEHLHQLGEVSYTHTHVITGDHSHEKVN